MMRFEEVMEPSRGAALWEEALSLGQALFIFIFVHMLLPSCMMVHHMVTLETRRCYWFPGTAVIDNYEPLCAWWGLNNVPLLEKQVPLFKK